MPEYNTYVGARYVPIFDGDWDSTKKYDPLTIVMHEGNSYTSKTYVPVGAEITNRTYWALTGNYNAQVAQLMESVEEIQEHRPYVTPEMFGAAGDGVTVDNIALNNCFAFAHSHNFTVVGVGKYLVDDSTDTIDGHKGVLVPGAVKAYNLNLRLKSSVAAKTSILTCKYSSGDYLFYNCRFDMADSYDNTGSEDGGNHGIFFVYDTTFPYEYYAGSGNVIIDSCTFNNIWSYGIFATPVIAKLVVKNTSFENARLMGLVPYFTDIYIDQVRYNGDFTARTNHNSVKNLVQYEPEHLTNTNEKKVNITITNTISNAILLICFNLSQSNLIFDTTTIINCRAATRGVDVGNNTLTIDGHGEGATAPPSNTLFIDGFKSGTSERQCNISTGITKNVYVNNSFFNALVSRGETVTISNSSFVYIQPILSKKLTINDSETIRSGWFGNISTNGTELTEADTGIPEIEINNLHAADIATANTALMRNCRFGRCVINGLTTAPNQEMFIVNNYSYREDSATRSLYAKNIFHDTPQSQYGFSIQGVDTCVAEYIGPTNGVTEEYNTHAKINQLWYT